MNTKSLFRTAVVAVPLAVAFLVRAGSAQPAPPTQPRWAEFERLDEKSRLLVVSWLAEDCEAGERLRRLVEIQIAGQRLVPVLREAYALGPPPARVAASRAAAQRAFEQRQAWLRADGEKTFSAEEYRRLSAETADGYAARQLRSADQGWRERALIALGRAGDDKALADLAKIAADPNDPHAAAAKRAIEERQAKPRD